MGNSGGIFIAALCSSEQEARTTSCFFSLVAQKQASVTQAKQQADTHN